MAPSDAVKAQPSKSAPPQSRSSLVAAQGHLKHVLALMKDENADRFTCEDLIMLYQEVSGCATIDEDVSDVDEENSNVSNSPGDSADPARVPKRRNTIMRLAAEDKEWLMKAAA